MINVIGWLFKHGYFMAVLLLKMCLSRTVKMLNFTSVEKKLSKEYSNDHPALFKTNTRKPARQSVQ